MHEGRGAWILNSTNCICFYIEYSFYPIVGAKGTRTGSKMALLYDALQVHSLDISDFLHGCQGHKYSKLVYSGFYRKLFKIWRKRGWIGPKIGSFIIFFLNTVLETFFIFCMMVDYHEYFKNLYLFLST